MILFNLLAILFIWNELYYFINYDKLGTKINIDNFETFNKIDLFYYLSKIVYWIWIFVGCAFIGTIPFNLILGLSILRIPMFLFGLKMYRKYSLLNIFISICCLFYILTSLFF